jgi:RNA-binding protein
MLTTRQRAYLRGLANDLEPIIHIGKAGITENLLKQGDDALNAREIIKGTVLENAPLTAREAIDALCSALRAEPVQTIGRRFVLYRKNHDKPQIVLPT